MDRIERIFNALLYIEDCLPYTADLKEIANKANMSPYHFHRLFTLLVGETVGKYCQRRRLTLAAKRLLYTNEKILCIALSHGYDSQATFSRAFKEMFYVSPKDFRNTMTEVPLFSVDPIIKNVKYSKEFIDKNKIIENDQSPVIGLMGLETSSTKSVGLWREFFLQKEKINEVAESQNLYNVNRFKNNGILTEETPFIKFVGIRVLDQELCSDEIVCDDSFKLKYVVFTEKKNLEVLKKDFCFIYGRWFPQNLAQESEKEKYFLSDDDNLETLYPPE